ncbi:hypothetical protein LTR64_000157 [Lithohypha guttulata]|uniref:uncharacterized protein n=1 Tax=Lithohypha guttulata TaxID=1690604 RepID=UPI002DE180E8|nr:hypothetical protein LTR51_007519 [Lithohypha guttulata]
MAILKSKQKAGHAAGIFSDMTLDGPEIGTLVAVVDRAKNLPNRKAMGKQDPYCAMRLAKEAKKTGTDRRGGQTPKWDQELRFNVHDSPDYYKLKCSIFNDDKKTELIGEAWIDLYDVIKLGGGQSDLWHQLNFKGKYAGDIRVELTFYDTREQPQERRRRERLLSMLDEVSSEPSLPAQRSLGPREIKRRPLPSSPAGSAALQSQSVYADTTIAQPPPSLPTDERHQQAHAPPLPPAEDESLRYSSYQQPQDLHHYQPAPSTASHQAAEPLRHYRGQSPSYTEPQQIRQSSSAQDSADVSPDAYSAYSTVSNDFSTQSHHYAPRDMSYGPEYPDEQELWHHQRPQSIHTHSEPIAVQQITPDHRPTATSTNSDGQIVQYHHHRQSESNSYATPSYIESPLKQSMSQHELHLQVMHADAPPPLPPKHRDTPPRRQRDECPPSAYIPEPLRIGAKRSSLSNRSPLQSLEDDCGIPRQTTNQVCTPPSQRHTVYMQTPSQAHATLEGVSHHSGRRSTYTEQAQSSETQLPWHIATTHSRRQSYDVRHSSFDQQLTEESQHMTPQGYHSGYEEDYQPTVEDAPPSPGLRPIVTRKAVGAKPHRLNGVPFNPDSYDVLNPGSSPVTNENTAFETPEQAKEAQRLREVEKLRDLGPIIGNDGREIDPSDHLPADTWAPEPERKQRKPEHVIHIRSKNDSNRPVGARPSPIVIRSRGGTAPSLHSSPAELPRLMSQPDSPSSALTTPSSLVGGRNRHQKIQPPHVRPLPNQPYVSTSAAAVSSPAMVNPPQRPDDGGTEHQQSPLQPRQPSYDNRVPAHLTRPSLSEYQVPVANSRRGSYNPHHNGVKVIDYKPYDSTPTKQPPQSYHGNYSAPTVEDVHRQSYDKRQNSYKQNTYDDRNDYSYENHIEAQRPQQGYQQHQAHRDDSFAAEMSLINIPSRDNYHQGSMGRSMVRRW